jgi:hypothetical protein
MDSNTVFDYDADFSRRFPNLVLDEEEKSIEASLDDWVPVTGKELELILSIVRSGKKNDSCFDARQESPAVGV